jgi:hypothetical protein
MKPEHKVTLGLCLFGVGIASMAFLFGALVGVIVQLILK